MASSTRWGRWGERLRGWTQNPDLSEGIPEAPDIQGDSALPAPGEAGESLYEEQRKSEEEQFAAEQEDQARALELGEKVRGSREEVTEEFKKHGTELEQDQVRLQEGLQEQGEELRQIPGQITSEFERLRQEFGEQADASFDRIEGQREEALGQVMQGRSMAMQASVQNIQGNINTQVAQIQANQNLTDAQKQGMISQVKLAGASSMAPAIGSTVLQFNQLAADTATKFGDITGQLERTGLMQKAGLVGMQGQAFTQAQTAVGQMTNQLLELDANSSVASAQAQGQLLSMRSQAELMNNDVLLKLLPEQSTPYANFTGSAATQYQVSNDIIKSQFAMDLQSFSVGLQAAMAENMIGNPMQKLFEGLASGFASGGWKGALFGGVGGLLG